MSDIQLLALVAGLNILYLWLEVLDVRRKAKKRMEAIEKRLAALEANSTEEARYMAGTWLS